MNDIFVPNLKLLFKPIVVYYGEWELGEELHDIAIIKNGKNLYDEFLNRYYYMPLNVIFKDDTIVKTFELAICSRLVNNTRNLYFSKRAFLRKLINNIDEIVDINGDGVYKEIKKAIRNKKDEYRDVANLGEESEYYESVRGEYLNSNLEMDFEDFVDMCKKQYTKFLGGYNAVLDLFNKSINTDTFIKCFDIDKLYLYVCYRLLEHNKDYYDKYGKFDYNISFIDDYRNIVLKVREKENFYNTSLMVNKDGGKVVLTVDDLFKQLDELYEYTKK